MADSIGRETRVGHDPPDRRMSGVAEALGYVGGALALAAVGVLVSAFWGVLGPWGRVGIAGVMGAAALAGGFAIERMDASAAKRLSQFLLFAGVAGIGGAVGLLVFHLVRTSMSGTPGSMMNATDWGWFSALATVAVAGGAIWWTRRTWLQHIAFGLGVGLSALLALPLVPIEGPDWGAGAVLALVGLIWGALALRGRLEPENAALALSVLGILGGIELMAVSNPNVDITTWPLWVGVAVSLVLLVFGLRAKKFVVGALSGVGLMVFTVEVVTSVFEEGIGVPIALLGIGIACLVGGTYLAVRSARRETATVPVLAEIVCYIGAALSMAGGGVLMGSFYDELGVAGRIAVPVIGMAVAYGTGIYLGRIDTSSAHRLNQVLTSIGVLLAGIAGAMVAQPILDRVFDTTVNEYSFYRESSTSLAGAAAGLVAGAITWWFRKGAVTLAAFGVALNMTVMLAFNLLNPPPTFELEPWVQGTVLAAIGVVWVALGIAERLNPANTAIAVGAVGTIFGLQVMQRGPHGELMAWAAWLAIAIAVAGIVAAIYFRRGVLLGLGALAVAIFSISTVMGLFGRRLAAPIVLLVAGVVFIALAVMLAVVLPKWRGPSKHAPVASA